MGGMKKAEMFSHSCSLAVNLISTLFRIAFDLGSPFLRYLQPLQKRALLSLALCLELEAPWLLP
jgi:hypothetical protein